MHASCTLQIGTVAAETTHLRVCANLECVKFSSFLVFSFFLKVLTSMRCFFYLRVLVGEAALTLYVPMLLFVYVLTAAICAESAWLGRGVKVCSPTFIGHFSSLPQNSRLASIESRLFLNSLWEGVEVGRGSGWGVESAGVYLAVGVQLVSYESRAGSGPG